MSDKLLICLAALLICATTVQAAKRGLPEQVIPECFGVNIHFTGDNDKEVKQIADAGFKFIRMDFSWVHIEKEKGKYNFTEYDGLMTALDRHGIRPLFILDYGNPLYDGDMAPHTDEGRKAFAAFARAAASHFKDRGILWEIWNEPNGSGFWRPNPNPQNYALLANLTAKAVKEADKTAIVLGPALAGMDMGYIEQIFKGGVLENIDVVSVHPYRGQNPESAAADYTVLRTLVDRYAPKGKQFPIVSGEWGYSAAGMSVEQQARFLVRQFLSNMLCGVQLSIWYDWHNDGQDPKENEHNFGTVYWDFSPKPAYRAVQALTQELAGYRLVRRLYAKSQDDFILLFKNGKDHKLAAWTTGEPHETDIPLDVQSCGIIDIYGKRSRSKVMSGMLKLALSQDMLYVDVPAESKRLSIEESFSVEPAPVKQVNAGVLPAVCRLTNPLDTAINVGIAVKEPVQGKVVDMTTFKLGPGKTAAKQMTLEQPWDGSGSLSTLVEMAIEGIDEPFMRTLEFDTSRRFRVSAAPPANNMVLLDFSNPSGEQFAGKVMLSGGPGITVSEIVVPVALAKDQSFAQVRYPVVLADRKQYTMRYTVLDAENNEVFTIPERTYKMLEPFEKSDVVEVVMDGDAKVRGTTGLSASALPEKLPGVTTCLKMDYDFGSGWKFARLAPKSAMEIDPKIKEIGVWVYGDKSGNHIRARVTDSTGQTFQPHLATLDWEGWRFATCKIEASRMGWWGGAADGVIHPPLKWDTLLLLDSAGGREQRGEVYIGPMWIMY